MSIFSIKGYCVLPSKSSEAALFFSIAEDHIIEFVFLPKVSSYVCLKINYIVSVRFLLVTRDRKYLDWLKQKE